MAVNMQKIAASVLDGTFDPHSQEALKALNDAHERMLPGQCVAEIRKVAAIIYRSDLALDSPEVLRALNIARATLAVDAQMLGGAVGAIEAVPMAVVDTLDLVTNPEAQRDFVKAVWAMLKEPAETLSGAARTALANAYESDNTGFELGRQQGHMLANVALGAAVVKSTVKAVSTTESAAQMANGPGRVTTYIDTAIKSDSLAQRFAVRPRLVTRTDLGGGYAVHVAENQGYGSRLSVEIPVNETQKILVDIPSAVAREYNFYIDMSRTISELEARLGQRASMEGLEDLKAATTQIEKTYIQAVAISLGLDEPTLWATKYALHLAKELGFKFPEDPAVFVHDHMPGPYCP